MSLSDPAPMPVQTPATLPTELMPAGAERRLARRAAAAWEAQWAVRAPPRLGDVLRIEPDLATRAVLLDIAGGGAGVRVASLCGALGLRFGLAEDDWLDVGGEDMGGLLARAAAAVRDSGEATPFEGAVAGASAACMLVRGVALPLYDATTSLSYACALVGWKELLDGPATTRIHQELAAAFAGPALS